MKSRWASVKAILKINGEMKKSMTGKLKIGFSILTILLFMPMFFMGCSGQEDKEQNFPGAEDAAVKEECTENMEDIPYSEAADEFFGETVAQVIEGADGRKISIDAQVFADGINQVSCYKYVPEPFTEERREDLLKIMHPAETWDVIEAVEYNQEKDVWEFVTPRGESWIYQIIRSEIPVEDILNHKETATDIYSDIKQIFPIVVQDDAMAEMDEYTYTTLLKVRDISSAEIEQLGLYDIGAIDKNGSYSCDLIHVCETDDGQFFIKAVFRKIIDGMPVTAWHDFSTATGKDSPFPVKIWGSFYSEEEIGLDKPILSVHEAITAMQEQIDQIPIQEKSLSVTKISLEYLSVISSEGDLLIVPVWRFWAGEDEKEQSQRSEEVIAVNAISGELIWENRKAFTE